MRPDPDRDLPAAASQPLKAAAWMMGTVISFTSMALAVRALGAELDTFEMMTYRSFLGLALVVAVAAFSGTLGQIGTARLGFHVLRNAVHFTAQNLWFYAITVLPLAQVFAIEFTAPLWVAVLAPVMLAERMTRARLIAAALGFVGVLIVARPGSVPLSAGMVAIVVAALGFAVNAILTKMLTRTQGVTQILFWLTLLQGIFGLLLSGWDGDIAVPSAGLAPWVLVVGVAGLSAHFCLTTALGLAPAVVVMPLDFLRLPIAAILGMVLYAEAINPMVLIGAAIIFAANYFGVLSERRRART
jgi:drug/metabolite transporter (DMT)-like permease